jgi:hypothetical protein
MKIRNNMQRIEWAYGLFRTSSGTNFNGNGKGTYDMFSGDFS